MPSLMRFLCAEAVGFASFFSAPSASVAPRQAVLARNERRFIGIGDCDECLVIGSSLLQFDALSGSSGFARGIKDFSDNHIYGEGGKTRRLNIPADNGCQVGERLGLRTRQGRRVTLSLSAAFLSNVQQVSARNENVAGLTIDFYVFAIEGPVPGGLQNGLRLRIGDDDCGFIFNFGV